MSFFTEEFDDLRTNQDFNNYVNNVDTYQQSNEYQNILNQLSQKNKNDVRTHICKIINDHFNCHDQVNFDVEKTSLTIYIGVLDNNDQSELISVLTNKGYVCTTSGGFLTISSAQV